MKRLSLILLVVSAFVFPVRGQESAAPEGIRFEHGTWDEALAKAKSENKLLFVDVWATWCGPCKRLANEVFPQKEVGDFFNSHFVSYKLQIDIEDKATRERYQQLANSYNAAALPTLLWVNGDGKLEHFSVGYVQAGALLEEARKALDPSLRTSHITDNWDSQAHTLENGLVYFEANPKETGKFDEFFLALTPKEQMDERLKTLLYFKMTLPPDSKALHYMAAKKDSLSALYPEAKEWETMVESQLRRLLGATPMEEMDALTAKFAAYNLPFLPQLADHIRCLMLFRYERTDEAFRLAGSMTEKYGFGRFLKDFIEVGFFMATKQHALFTAEQKATFLTWAKEVTASMTERDGYAKDLTLFEAYALNGMKAEAAACVDALKQASSRQEQIQFYEELAASAEQIR